MDDCFNAAVATVLQIPLGESFDSRMDRRIRAGEDPDDITVTVEREFERWLSHRGLEMRVHKKVPPAKKRWIGIVSMGFSRDHCMVMSGDEVLFDPTADLGTPVQAFGIDEVDFGISFAKKRRK